VELVDHHHWRTRAEARALISPTIHRFNRVRLHTTIGYLRPWNGHGDRPLITRQYHPGRSITVSGLGVQDAYKEMR
jgi:hypothetical protein